MLSPEVWMGWTFFVMLIGLISRVSPRLQSIFFREEGMVVLRGRFSFDQSGLPAHSGRSGLLGPCVPAGCSNQPDISTTRWDPDASFLFKSRATLAFPGHRFRR